MYGAVVLIVYLAAALPFVHLLRNDFNCEKGYYKKRIGTNNYCYIIHRIGRGNTTIDENLKSIATTDQEICQRKSKHPYTFSTSIRNKAEFDVIKMLYRTFERKEWRLLSDRNDFPLLIGLTYINNDYHWFDRSPFAYDEFMDIGHKSNFSLFTTKDCRRFFLYSPPTQYHRIFYTFDIDCYSQFQNYYVVCRYKILCEREDEDDDRRLDYQDHDYDLKVEKRFDNTNKAITAKLFQHNAVLKTLLISPITIFLFRF
ncbi:hypothetical protein ACH3XW_10765 [Acanthocheilonema viteae]